MKIEKMKTLVAVLLVCSLGSSILAVQDEGTVASVIKSQRQVGVKGANLIPNGGFDKFDGDVPSEWTFESWNQEFLQEKVGKSSPGYGGEGSCFEMYPGYSMAVITVTSQYIPVYGTCDYVFKGYYLSECKKIGVQGKWFDKDKKQVGDKFEFILPETQGQWIEFFDEVSSPSGAKYLQFELKKRGEAKRVCFDDFSLRVGNLMDYEKEFSLSVIEQNPTEFPIFAWLPPNKWRHFGKKVDMFDTDRVHSEYALAGFSVGLRAKFGMRKFMGGGWLKSVSDEELAKVENDPDVWVISGGDEPRDDRFAELAKMNERIKKNAPSKPFWVNLLPNYGFKSNDEYEKHLRNYIQTVKPEFFTYDHYTLGSSGGYSDAFFQNLVIAYREAQAAGIDYGVINDVVGFYGIRSPNEFELSWQAYCSLVHGAKALGWFTYLTEIECRMNYHDAVIDRDGNRTRHYSMMKKLNNDIRRIGHVLLKLRLNGVYHIGRVPKMCDGLDKAEFVSKVREGDNLIIGEFTDNDKNVYIMVVNRDYEKKQSVLVQLKHPRTVLECSKQTGQWESNTCKGGNDVFRFDLAPGDGRLFVLK